MAFKMKGMSNLQAQHQGTSMYKKRVAAFRDVEQGENPNARTGGELISTETTRFSGEEGGRTGTFTSIVDTYKVAGSSKRSGGTFVSVWDKMTPQQKQEHGGDFSKWKQAALDWNKVQKNPERYYDKVETRFNPNVEPMEPRTSDVSTTTRPETVERSEDSIDLGTIMGLNRNKALSKHAEKYFDTTFSTDNPSFDVLKDDKLMRKARKQYNKNYEGKKRLKMPFERWVTQVHVFEGQNSTLVDKARAWEGTQPTDTDTSGDVKNREITGAGDTAKSRYSKAPSSRDIDVY